MKTQIQRMGRFLSSMVMPNIGAFIAWGFITALFIPTGWLPNEELAKLVGPMITYLLPLLIAYKGGELIYGVRGGVLGVIAAIGVVVGADIPMFIGGMIMGPLGGYLIKQFDRLFQDKIPAGFEMLVNNFSAGILGMLLALAGLVGIAPIIQACSSALSNALQVVINHNLLPIASLVIEPGKILFLNNALNHGILGPLGVQEVQEHGKSIFFLLETNPGPGLGVLVAYWLFAKGAVKESAPSAIIIHFLGGIHEIYFPYILMKPLLLISVIAGGATGVFTNVLLNNGLVATPSPGSIFALLAMAPKGEQLSVVIGVLTAAAVSFLVSAVILKADKKEMNAEALNSAQDQVQTQKAQSKGQSKAEVSFVEPALNGANLTELDHFDGRIQKIVFACDAGMGSSAMGASTLRNKMTKAGAKVEVVNEAIENIPRDAQIVITHKDLYKRAKEVSPDATHIVIDDFINTPAYDLLVERVKEMKAQEVEVVTVDEPETTVLKRKNIVLNAKAADKYEAIRMAGRLLVESGYVNEEYIEAMVQREEDLTTYLGNGVAIPHGVGEAKKNIKKTGICVLQFPEGVDFDGEPAYLIIGIAGLGNEHITILSNLATLMEEPDVIDQLRATTDLEFVHELFTQKGDQE